MHDLSDTIVAVSSAAGGVRSIVRITGPRTLEICECILEPQSAAGCAMHTLFSTSGLASVCTTHPTRRISHRTILPSSVCINNALSVDALLYPFLAPHSYTGEDLVELHVFASSCLVEALLERLLASGCRVAGPGEFTARAYLNGKLDLAQAEAVNEVINSSNSLQLEAAERLLSGRLTKATEEIRAALLDTLSLIEAGLDFSGEDIQFISTEQAAQRLAEIRKSLEDLLAGSIRCETLMDLPAVGIAGAPNAGKSSLLNALLGWERSIVSPQPKTTRDVLTGVLTVGSGGTDGVSSLKCEVSSEESQVSSSATSDLTLGTSNSFPCVLFDCAGLVPSPDNILDELAQRAAIEALQRCTAVLFCVDSAKVDWGEDLAIRTLIQPKNLICVATKSDLAGEESVPCRAKALTAAFGAEFLPVSATKRAGLDELVQAIEHAVGRGDACVARTGKITPDGVTTNAEGGESILALTARHRQAVTETVESVRQAIAEVKLGREEVAVLMIRTACEAIGGIEQQPLDEQVLDRIFSRFCVGK